MADPDDVQWEMLRRIDESTRRLTKLLDGNGTPGIVTRVTLNEQRDKGMERDIARLERKIDDGLARAFARIEKADHRIRSEEDQWKFWAKVGGLGAAAAALIEVAMRTLQGG